MKVNIKRSESTEGFLRKTKVYDAEVQVQMETDEIETAKASGWAVIAASTIVTVAVYLVAYGTFGGGA